MSFVDLRFRPVDRGSLVIVGGVLDHCAIQLEAASRQRGALGYSCPALVRSWQHRRSIRDCIVGQV